MLYKCSCYHAYQNKKYGFGIRVHNLSGKDSTKARCTVCGTVKDIGKTFKKEEIKEK